MHDPRQRQGDELNIFARNTFIMSLLTALAGCFIMLVVSASSSTVKKLVQGNMPEDAIVVSRSSMALGPLAVSSGALPSKLEKRLKSDPRVKSVASEVSLGVPASIVGHLFGHAYGSDVAVIGVDPKQLSWIAPDIDPSTFQNQQPIPIIAPGVFLTAYNHSFAPANGLPHLTASAFIGPRFEMNIGSSSINTLPEAYIASAHIVGFTNQSNFIGLLVPRDIIEEMNSRFKKSNSLKRLFVFPNSPAEGQSLEAEFKAMNLKIDSPAQRYERLTNITYLTNAIFVCLSLAFILITGMTSFFAAMARVLESKEQAELLHELGLQRRSILLSFVKMFLPESFAGALAGTSSALLLFALFLKFLPPDLPIDPSLSFAHAAIIAAAASAIPLAGISLGSFLGASAVVPSWNRRA